MFKKYGGKGQTQYAPQAREKPSDFNWCEDCGRYRTNGHEHEDSPKLVELAQAVLLADGVRFQAYLEFRAASTALANRLGVADLGGIIDLAHKTIAESETEIC